MALPSTFIDMHSPHFYFEFIQKKKKQFNVCLISNNLAKNLIAELTPPHVQSTWGFRRKMVRVRGLATCCNYFSKKKKKSQQFSVRLALI